MARRSPFHSHTPEASHRNRRCGMGEEGQRVPTLRLLLRALVTLAPAAWTSPDPQPRRPPPAELPQSPGAGTHAL